MGLIKKNDIPYGGSKNLTAGDGIDITGDTVSVNNEVAITSDVANGVRLFATGVPLGPDDYYIQLSTGSDRDVGGIKDKAVAINFCAGSKQMFIGGYKWNAESTAGNKWENLFLLDCEDTGWKTLDINPSVTETVTISYRKKLGIVYLKIHSQSLALKDQATAGAPVIATLPVGFRPSGQMYNVGTTTSFRGISGVTIATNGNISMCAVGPNGTTATGVAFDTSYPAA